MNNRIESEKSKEVAIIDENQIKQFQSLYYLIKGKRDTDIKLFTDYKQFTYDDIIELNDKVYRKLRNHELITDIVGVTVGLSSKEIKSFGSWEEFKNTDWIISECTRYISIEWDFNLITPNQTHPVPQTHTMRVRIGNSLKPSEMIHVMFQGGEEYDLEEVQAQMSCKIDFINAQICSELKKVVSDWYDTLADNSEEHTVTKLVIRHDVKLQTFVIVSFIIAGVILVNYLFNTFYYSEISFLPVDKVHRLFLIATSSVTIMYIFYILGRFLASSIMRRYIHKLSRNPMFNFTRGDKNKFREVRKENKKILNRLLITLLIGLSVNAISAIIGELIKKILE
jgi:hypothetical protein